MKTKHPSLRNLRAFTLIELLVVVVIIAILASFLMPTVASYKEQGRAVQCANNMRQLLAGRKLYSTDNNGLTIPLRPEWPGDANGICTWRYYLNQRYGISAKSFLCPSAPSVAKESGGESWRTSTGDLDSNYAQLGNTPWNMSTPMAIVQTPAQQLELIETRDHWPDLQISNWQTVWGDGYGVYGYWHSLRMTCGYADGHVEKKKLGQTATPICQWDTDKGLADGKTTHSGDYSAMPNYYK